MYKKIYFGEAIIIIHNEESTPTLSQSNKVFFKEIIQPSKKFLKSLQENFAADMKENYSFYVDDVEQFFKKFSEAYTSIDAAGGIVQNNEKEVLFIYRLGKWDLPKGKIEAGETPAIAAAREITEETGVSGLTLTEPICKTYHIYPAFNKTFLKTSHWFHFTTIDDAQLIAQTEENITEVKWIATKDIKEPVTNTYQNIKDVLSTYFDKP
jgi:8-oxo-dGTP pyrophosphatase MutT (NUDIX family)